MRLFLPTLRHDWPFADRPFPKKRCVRTPRTSFPTPAHPTSPPPPPNLLPKQARWTEKKCDSRLEGKVSRLYIGSALPKGRGIRLPWPWGLESSCGPPVIRLCWSWSALKTHTTTARHWRKQVWGRRLWAPLGSDSIGTSPQQRVSKLLHFYGLKWKGMNDHGLRPKVHNPDSGHCVLKPNFLRVWIFKTLWL